MNKHLPNKFIPAPSEQLSYILGVLYGDATIYKTRQRYKNRKDYTAHMICLSVRDYEFALAFSKALSNIFKKEIKVFSCDEKRGRGIFYKVFLASKSFYDWYTDAEDIFEIGAIYPRPFIKGIYDSEGSFGYVTYRKTGKHPTIRIVSSNMRLLEKLSDLLKKEFGITCRLRNRGIPNPSKMRSRIVIWKKPVYRLGIFKKADIETFFNYVGTSISTKMR